MFHHVNRRYFQSNPIATALKDLENRNERALYANWKPLQIINNRMALLFRHNASESEHTLLYVHHFIFHPLHRLTESEQYHLLYSSIEDVPTIAEKLRYARHMKGLRQKDIAEYLNIHLSLYNNYENPGYEQFPVRDLEKLADFYHLRMSELFDTYHLFLYQHQISSLKSFRKNNSLTQRQLADILGVSRTALQCWENGYRNLPKDIYKKLLEAGMKIV